jgi:hypothetical protein
MQSLFPYSDVCYTGLYLGAKFCLQFHLLDKMETRIRLPLGPLPEDVDSDWTPLKKALETYRLTVAHCISSS